jgi:pimeloyl-ACP methyl ester carboxylesterase
MEPYVFENAKGDKVDAELGTFQVLENRDNPESKVLNLKFVKFKSTSKNPGFPIIYLAGGPGGSGIGTARGNRFDLFMKMREIGDVIAFDQRGTGMSDGLPNYPGFYILDLEKPLTKENAQHTVAEEALKMEAFFKEEGHDLSGYNSNQSADDLNELRIALGAEKMNIWGISYGSHLALTTLKRHEDKINKIIIAGVEGYDDTVKLPSDQQELLEQIDQMLKDDPKTNKVYPDFLGDIEKLLTQVDQNPVTVTTKNPMNGESIEMVMGKLDHQILLSWYLGGPENFKDMPLDIKKMLAGDYTPNTDFLFYIRAGQLRGMSKGMDIASGISAERRQRIAKESKETLLGDAINFPYFIEYDALKHLDLGEDFRKPFSSKVPVFCISGTLDGRTAVKNADFALKTLENGHHLIIEGAGHSDPLFLSSPKIADYMIDFMNGKDIGNPKITLAPVEYELPMN